MSITQSLSAVFGAALAPLAQDGVLHATTLADTGAGGVTAATLDIPVKVLVEGLSAQDRIGLPREAVRLVVLGAGLARPVGLDDGLTVGGVPYRVIAVDADAAGASYAVTGVPA